MSDRSDAPEGWHVRQRRPILAAAATLAGLTLILATAGYFYDRGLKPKTYQPTATFPAPGVETFIHDGGNDPHPPAPKVQADPRLEAAKRAVVLGGLPGWEPHP